MTTEELRDRAEIAWKEYTPNFPTKGITALCTAAFMAGYLQAASDLRGEPTGEETRWTISPPPLQS